MIDFTQQATAASSLSEFYDWIQPELQALNAAKTLTAHREFLSHWIRTTGDPPLNQISRDDLQMFRDGLLNGTWQNKRGQTVNGVSPRTFQKHHGTYRQLMKAAQTVGLIESVPQLFVTRKSALTPSEAATTTKPVRDIIGPEEMRRLYHGAALSTWPLRYPSVNPPIRGRRFGPDERVLRWRAAIYFGWLYGVRISDACTLSADCFDFTPHEHAPHGMLVFAPWKIRRKGRLQGLPLTATAAALVRRITRGPRCLFWFLHENRAGCWNSRRKRWESGHIKALQLEICASQGIIPTTGPKSLTRSVKQRRDALPGLTYHVFRQTAVTQYNDFATSSGRALGDYIVGHSSGTVAGESYDKPDAAVWRAIEARDRDQLPECWRGLFANLN